MSTGRIGQQHDSLSPCQPQLEEVAKICRIAPGSIESIYPCLPMQEDLMVSSYVRENSYMMQLVFSLEQRDDPGFLDRFLLAWKKTIRANPILRTRICRLSEGSPSGFIQVVVDEDMACQFTQDLSRYLQEDARTLMLQGDKLFRYAIITEQRDRYFVWTAHHAVCDAISILELLIESSRRFHEQEMPVREPFDLFVQSVITSKDQANTASFWQSVSSRSFGAAIPYPQVPRTADFRVDASCTVNNSVTLKRFPNLPISRSFILRAAWAILLSHHAGSEHVTFGVIVNGRKSTSAPLGSQATGPTICLLPIALHVDPKKSVGSFLTDVRAQGVEMEAVQQQGLSGMRRLLDSRKEPTGFLDFQSLFVVHAEQVRQTSDIAGAHLGLKYLDHLGKHEQHPYPLIASLTLTAGETVRFNIQHDPRIVSSKHANNLIHQFQAILNGLTQASAESLLETVNPVSEEDMAQIRRWYEANPTQPTEETCLHHTFEQQVNRAPHAEALQSVDQTLTYAQVDQMASALALRLLDADVAPGKFVALCFEKSVLAVVAMLAVLKAGAAYVPIEPTHPRGRIAEVLDMAHVKVAIASRQGATVLTGMCDQILELDQGSLTNFNTSPLPGNTLIKGLAKPSDAAYVLFTSGSTGKPKGVIMSHSAICTSIRHHGNAFGADTDWRTLQFAAYTFDISVAEIFTTLAHGGCVCIPSDHDRMNNLAGVINHLNVNTLLVVPTVATLIKPSEVPMLKTLVLGGEPITKEIIARWANDVRLIDGYGPSETAVYCAANLKVSTDSDPTNIGQCIGGAMWIVDPQDHHRLSAIGLVGEIVISGAILGNGYLDSATTNAAFVAAPEWLRKLCPESASDKIYKTGDLARYNHIDGSFDIVGRKDSQVKLRGFRIELGEIENRVMALGMASAAVATLPRQGPCKDRIVLAVSFAQLEMMTNSQNGLGAISLADNSTFRLNLDRIKSHLALSLPDYMLPAIWVPLDKMPLLVSGKVDRRSLTSSIDLMDEKTYFELVREDDQAVGDTSESLEKGSVVATLRTLWCEVLGVSIEEINTNTSFFSLGGDSIFAIQMVSKANKYGLSLSVGQIIRNNTLGKLAKVVEVQQSDGSGIESGPHHSFALNGEQRRMAIAQVYKERLESLLAYHPDAKIEDAYPLSPIQREIMKQRQINPFVFVLEWEVDIFSRSSEPLSLERLVRAWKRTVKRQPILRSIFLRHKEELPLQVVVVGVEPEVVIGIDTELPPLEKCLLPHKSRFFEQGGKVMGSIALDHLVIDGWSFRLIKEDLLAAYDADHDLEAPTALYKSYISTLMPDRVHADRKYWASKLSQVSPSLIFLPVSNSQTNCAPSPQKTMLYFGDVDAATMSAFSSKSGLTPASIFGAAWAQTLAEFTKSSDVTFEYVVSGRDENIPGVFEIVGPMMNVLVNHLKGVSTENSVEVLTHVAHEIQDQRMLDVAHSSCNIREVIEEELGLDKLTNSGLNFQRRPTAVETNNTRVDDDLLRMNDPWHFDILVRVLHVVDDNIIRIAAEFDPKMFDTERMKKVMTLFWEKVQMVLV
ncbi:non-ribosomal peptide synthetase module [Xylariales sp. PMI_506]|nr:non-ribosomal peptide synthetase module [Xylariales sp. PMI_506]